eukprot:gb/GEZN01011434.1/.p1 GENE.gb/GEZN01011434.1/~~gb/GEZN01011434.1/.p1  ORF type:complete len:154 (-),score=38.24 gb/GEZN01011434.1/:656-1117(-)
MQVFVKTLTGTTLTVEADTVASLKQTIFEKEGVPVDFQRLAVDRKELNDDGAILAGLLDEDSTVNLLVRMEGGGKKKRKKKVFTKPKRERHRKKKIKMAVLKYYRVDENNKITRLRRECNNKNCGACKVDFLIEKSDPRRKRNQNQHRGSNVR